MQVKKKLGELLIENGLITETQLEEVLRSKKSSQRLGQALINLNLVTQQDIINVLEFQLGIPQFILSDKSLDLEIIKLLPEAIAKRYGVIPVKLHKNKLTVAMTDPLNVVAIDDICLATGYEVEPVITTEEDMDKALSRYYGVQEQTDKALHELEISNVVERPELQDLKEGTGIGSDAPVVRVVNSIIEQAIYLKASDIHLEPMEDTMRVRFRVDGILKEFMKLPKGSASTVVSRIKIMADMDIAEKRLPQDGRVQLKIGQSEIDLRCSSVPTIFGEKIVMRILDKTNMLIRLDHLGFCSALLKEYKNLIGISYGMILVTGPTGSGKTTTLYATLKEINTIEKNTITIEDPVEYVLEGINQMGVNIKAGLTFASGLRSVLRQDPDIIMVGEIRDSETADIAVRAATTGHLVFSTLHTNDAAGALPRLIDMGVENFLVASALSGVVAQRLVRKICPYCKETYQLLPTAPERLFLGFKDEKLIFYRGQGCKECDNTGYKGRIAIQEILHVTSEMRELIMAKASAENIKQLAIEQGMVPLREDGIRKALQGITTIEEVMRVAYTE
jgi:type IV pilus assembly protein PilB